MKRLFFFITLLYLGFIGLAQDTIYLKNSNDTIPISKEKALYYKVIDKNTTPVEVNLYYINAIKISKAHYYSADLKIKDGEYESYFYNGNLEIKGTYKNDRMDGSWMAYNKDKNFIEEKANYQNDLRNGKTFTFYGNGKLKRMDVFVRDTAVLSTCYDSTGNILDCELIKDTVAYIKAEIMPAFPDGGVPALMHFLQKNIRYPIEAAEKGLEGKVIVKFYLDTDGSVKDPVVIKDGVGGGCADEAIRVVKSMPKWTPGFQKGKPVKVYYTLPVTFKIIQ